MAGVFHGEPVVIHLLFATWLLSAVGGNTAPGDWPQASLGLGELAFARQSGVEGQLLPPGPLMATPNVGR